MSRTLSWWRAPGPAGPSAVATIRGRNDDGDACEVWLPDAALPALAGHLEREADQPGDHPASDPFDRIRDSLTKLEHRESVSWSTFTGWCEQAGAGYDRFFRTAADDTVERMDRWWPLARNHLVDGELRTLSVKFYPPRADGRRRYRPFGVRFSETYRGRDPWRLHSYDVDTYYASLAGPGEGGQPTRRHEDDLIARLTRMLDDSERDPSVPPGHCRDLVAEWLRQTGADIALDGLPLRHAVVDARDESAGRRFLVELSLGTDGREPTATLTEASMPLDARYAEHPFALYFSLDATELLIDYAHRNLGLARPDHIPAERPRQRLIACFDALARAGHLAASQRQRATRDVVAAWLAGAGIEHRIGNTARYEKLAESYRAGPQCQFDLTLWMDPGPEQKIGFREFYDYLRRGGEGAEYGYSVKTPYSGLAKLVAYFEQRTGRRPGPDEGLEDRLANAMAALVGAGELGDNLPIEANRNRVAEWFTEAGVPAEQSFWHWVDMD
jgi:hypothetical protein